MTDLAQRNYVKYSPSLERKPANEDADIARVAEQINTMQRATFNSTRHGWSGTHARTQAILRGKLIVPDDLPAHLKQGELFSKGGEYEVVARISSELGIPGYDDRKSVPRGFALKVFGVEGEFLETGRDLPTQDIEFNSTPAIDLADAKTTREIFDLRLEHGVDTPELKAELRKRDDAELQLGRYNLPLTHLAAVRQYSQTAFRFGEYVMKFAIEPASEAQAAVASKEVGPEDEEDTLHKWTAEYFAEHEAVFDFQVQLLEDVDEQPIEYAGVAWDEKKYPWQKVAKLVFPPQDSWDAARRTAWEDSIRINPWDGLEAYRPLGSSNRLRKVVYKASNDLRRKLNHHYAEEYVRPDQFPA